MDDAAREGLLGFLVLFGVLGGATAVAFGMAALSAWLAKRRPGTTPQQRRELVARWLPGEPSPMAVFVEREETTLQWRWRIRRVDGTPIGEIFYEADGTVVLDFGDAGRERIDNTVPPHRHSVWRDGSGTVRGEHRRDRLWRGAVSRWTFTGEGIPGCEVAPEPGQGWFPDRMAMVADGCLVGRLGRFRPGQFAAAGDGSLSERAMAAMLAVELRRFL
jgi:hypothetical protein